MGQVGKGSRGTLGELLAGLAGPQPLGVRERPLELVTGRRVHQVVDRELVSLADAVGPVGADAKPRHVGDDQQGRVLQRQHVLPQLSECRVQVGVLALVLPGEVVALPHVGPTAAARVLARAALEAIMLAGGVVFGWRRLAEQPAQVDEVLLRRRALLELDGAPLGDELVRRQGATRARICHRGDGWLPAQDQVRDRLCAGMTDFAACRSVGTS